MVWHLRATLVLSVALVPLEAQQPGDGAVPLASLRRSDLTAGSPSEYTLLMLGLASETRSSTALRPLVGSRWDTLLERTRGGHESRARGSRMEWTPPHLRLWLNTSAARPQRDGAVWQGRGVTAAATGGFVVSYGPVSFALRPLAFVAENRSYSPPRPTAAAPPDFRDPFWGINIDLPYRYGEGAYARIDPGESFAAVRWRSVAAGVGTASQHWGPAHYYPLVLGTEGGGFPRAFAETRALPIGIGRVTAQWIFGVLEASRVSGLDPGARSRVASAVMASFIPAKFSALELGVTRFFHVRKEKGSVSWDNATFPFSGLLKQNSRDVLIGGANQLASVFARVAPLGASVEVYGEFLRDDHSVDLRDISLEPDHESAYTLGLRRVWRGDASVSAFTIERANGRFSHLARVRGQAPMYTHTAITEGHTIRGQPLASSALIGGGGLTAAFDRASAARARHFAFEVRGTAQNEEGGTWNGRQYGEYLIRGSEMRTFATRTVGVGVEVQRGYGANRTAGASISLSLR